MNRAVFEALKPGQLVELTCRLHAMATDLAERLAMNSTNSSRPPSSDPPFGKGGGVAAGSGDAGVTAGVGSSTPPVPSGKPPQVGGRKPGKQARRQPSVPTMTRHRPPGSLPLRA